MTNVFSNFPALSYSVIHQSPQVISTQNNEKEAKKKKTMEIVKTVAPIAVSAITIPITAIVTYKLSSKNTKALKAQIANIADDVQKLKSVDYSAFATDISNLKKSQEEILKNLKSQTTKSNNDSSKIWSALVALSGITGVAGRITNDKKDEVVSKVAERINNIENNTNRAVDSSNKAIDNAQQALASTPSSLSRKYTHNFNGIQLLCNNDAMNRDTVKYENALKQIQNAAPKYLYSEPCVKPITNKNPALWSITSEFAPIKEGGLGSVPVEIQNNVTKLGIQIPTFIPMYQREGSASLKQIDGKYTYTYKGKEFQLEKAASFKVDSYQNGKPRTEDVEIFVSNNDGKQLVFIKNDTYFDGTIYQTTDKTEEPEKFAFFSKAVYEFAKAKLDQSSVKGLNIPNREVFDQIPTPDAMILNDWQASPIAALARYKAPMENAHRQLDDKASKTLSEMNIITIGHNAMYQGSTQNNNDNAQRKEATTNIINTLFDSYAYDIVTNAKTNASETNKSDLGLKNLDNVLVLNSQDENNNHTNLLNMGICLSNYFHPVSENYAKELITTGNEELSGELMWALTQKSKAGSVVGIINGNDFNNLSIEAKKDTIFKQTGQDFITYNKNSHIDEIMNARNSNKKIFYNNFMLPFTENKRANGLVSEGNTELPLLSDDELEKTPIIASVGRLVSQKGIGIMSEAIKLLMDNWEKDFPNQNKPIFYVAGSDGEGGKHAQRLKDLKANELTKDDSNRVVFANGFAPMTAITAASDFFLLPSLFEPCGLTQGEAFAVATPVIGSAVGGIVDTVNRNGKTNGILTEKGSKLTAEGFYKAMKKGLDIYFNNPEQYKKMVNDSLAEDFSWIQPNNEGPVFDYLEKIGFDRNKLSLEKK